MSKELMEKYRIERQIDRVAETYADELQEIERNINKRVGNILAEMGSNAIVKVRVFLKREIDL